MLPPITRRPEPSIDATVAEYERPTGGEVAETVTHCFAAASSSYALRLLSVWPPISVNLFRAHSSVSALYRPLPDVG